nr:helix-turn-helix transcriptional regulator [Kineosporia mesophila]
MRARREQVGPEDVGIPASSSRRVPGLRRDEVAMLAGISTEYYTRLEQGRDRRPSAQVLDAIARVLRMDAAATVHLHRLAEGTGRPRRAARRVERIRPGVAELVDALAMPAWIEGRYLDILTANPLARSLSPLFEPGTNLLRSVVQAVAAGDDVVSDASVRGLLAQLRGTAGSDAEDPYLAALVGELILISDDIARAWSRHEVQAPPASTTYHLDHPQVGPLDLVIEKFHPVGATDQLLVICRGAPETPTEQSLSLLASMHGTAGQPVTGPQQVDLER